MLLFMCFFVVDLRTKKKKKRNSLADHTTHVQFALVCILCEEWGMRAFENIYADINNCEWILFRYLWYLMGEDGTRGCIYFW